jgi:hypothetical protein
MGLDNLERKLSRAFEVSFSSPMHFVGKNIARPYCRHLLLILWTLDHMPPELMPERSDDLIGKPEILV